MKNTSFCKNHFAVCLLVSLLFVLTFGSQTAWADEAPDSENDNNSAEHASLVADEDGDQATQSVEDGNESADEKRAADTNDGSTDGDDEAE